MGDGLPVQKCVLWSQTHRCWILEQQNRIRGSGFRWVVKTVERSPSGSTPLKAKCTDGWCPHSCVHSSAHRLILWLFKTSETQELLSHKSCCQALVSQVLRLAVTGWQSTWARTYSEQISEGQKQMLGTDRGQGSQKQAGIWAVSPHQEQVGQTEQQVRWSFTGPRRQGMILGVSWPRQSDAVT